MNTRRWHQGCGSAASDKRAKLRIRMQPRDRYFDNSGRDDVLSGGVRLVPITTPKGDFRVWTERTGNTPRVKVLLLHGGPGATHEYFAACDPYFPGTCSAPMAATWRCTTTRSPTSTGLSTSSAASSKVLDEVPRLIADLRVRLPQPSNADRPRASVRWCPANSMSPSSERASPGQ